MVVIGTCSLCSGPVSVPTLWLGMHPPTPSCMRCHAKPSAPFGPVVPMREAPAPSYPRSTLPLPEKAHPWRS